MQNSDLRLAKHWAKFAESIEIAESLQPQCGRGEHGDTMTLYELIHALRAIKEYANLQFVRHAKVGAERIENG